MADYPDVYADGYWINAGPFGVTLTLLRSDPPNGPGPEVPQETVARVRLSTNLAKAIGNGLVELATTTATQEAQAKASGPH